VARLGGKAVSVVRLAAALVPAVRPVAALRAMSPTNFAALFAVRQMLALVVTLSAVAAPALLVVAPRPVATLRAAMTVRSAAMAAPKGVDAPQEALAGRPELVGKPELVVRSELAARLAADLALALTAASVVRPVVLSGARPVVVWVPVLSWVARRAASA